MSNWEDDILQVSLSVKSLLEIIHNSNSAESQIDILRQVGSHAVSKGYSDLWNTCQEIEETYAINIFETDQSTSASPQNRMQEQIEGNLKSSQWDCIFHAVLDVNKIKRELPKLKSDKVSGIKRWFVIHKVLEEIDWLSDTMDSHFVQWVEDVYGWEWKTKDFKSVLSEFKNTDSLQWGSNTVKDMKTGLAYKDLADNVRSTFVDIRDGMVIDKPYWMKRPDLYINHPAK